MCGLPGPAGGGEDAADGQGAAGDRHPCSGGPRWSSLYEQARAGGIARSTPSRALKGAPFEHLCVTRHEGKTRATMKIQEGCDRYCAYCIIPAVRGPVRSMPLERGARRGRAAGDRRAIARSIVTGIHLASYGREHGRAADRRDPGRARRAGRGAGAPGLAGAGGGDRGLLPGAGGDVPGCARSSTCRCRAAATTVLAAHEPPLHRRRNTSPHCRAAAGGTCRAAPLTTDVHAPAFPGETDEEAAETLALCARRPPSRAFTCSPIPGARARVADRMPNQVPQAVKNRRAQELIALGNKLEASYVQRINRTGRGGAL